jgi:hypothetical protein
MNKTAIQLALDYINNEMLEIIEKADKNPDLPAPVGAVRFGNKIVQKLKDLLPTEQEQIEDAYTQGAEDEYYKKDKHGKTYYNETYKKEE